MNIDLKAILSGYDLQALRRTRAKVAAEKISLQGLAMEVVFGNRKLFLHQSGNPFMNLHNAVVQDLLLLIAKKKIPHKYQTEVQNFVLLLLNANVTEFNFSRRLGDAFVCFNHLLKNCPKIKEIGGDYFSHGVEPLRMWPNLKHINLDGLACSDDIFDWMHKNLPNIETLTVRLQDKKAFTSAGVNSLSKLEKLERLHIHIPFQRFDQTLFAHAAGKIPNLKELHMIQKSRDEIMSESCDHHKFVETYGKFYPQKKLTVKTICLSDLKQNWPQCLHAEHLIFLDFSSPRAVEKIKTIALPVESLTLINLPMNVVYFLCSKFGPEVVNLKVVSVSFNFDRETDRAIDVFKIIAPCPKIETFKLNSLSGLTGHQKLTQQHFKTLKSIECPIFSYNMDTEERDHLFKLFLLGSEAYNKTLNLETSMHSYDSVAYKALKADPSCLDKVEVLKMAMHDNDGSYHFDKTLAIASMLLLRSPYLRKIEFKSLGAFNDGEYDSDDSEFDRGEDFQDYIEKHHKDTFERLCTGLGGLLVCFTH